MKFKKSVLLALLWEKEIGPDFEDEETGEEFTIPRLKRVRTRITEQRRWETSKEMIFQDVDADRYFRTEYSVGSTEMQETSPFEYDEDEIECVEVTPVKVEKIEYKPLAQA